MKMNVAGFWITHSSSLWWLRSWICTFILKAVNPVHILNFPNHSVLETTAQLLQTRIKERNYTGLCCFYLIQVVTC